MHVLLCMMTMSRMVTTKTINTSLNLMLSKIPILKDFILNTASAASKKLIEIVVEYLNNVLGAE